MCHMKSVVLVSDASQGAISSSSRERYGHSGTPVAESVLSMLDTSQTAISSSPNEHCSRSAAETRSLYSRSQMLGVPPSEVVRTGSATGSVLELGLDSRCRMVARPAFH